jgi:hypothetical protein
MMEILDKETKGDDGETEGNGHQDYEGHWLLHDMGLRGIGFVLDGCHFIQVTQVMQQIIDRLVALILVSPDGTHYNRC